MFNLSVATLSINAEFKRKVPPGAVSLFPVLNVEIINWCEKDIIKGMQNIQQFTISNVHIKKRFTQLYQGVLTKDKAGQNWSAVYYF